MFWKKTKSKHVFNTDLSERFIAQMGEYENFSDANGKPINWEERKKEKEKLEIWAFNNCFPLGSVVQVGTKQVLIVSVDVSDNITKYKGCYYPQGIESYSDLIEFSHTEIDACYFVGWWNEPMKYKSGYKE